MAKATRRVALLLTFSLLILTSTVGVASSQAGNWKYDADRNGLIEVSNLEQLDAIRYDLAGDGESGQRWRRKQVRRRVPNLRDRSGLRERLQRL